MGHRCSSGCGWDSCEMVSRCLEVREGGKEDEMECILGDMGAEMTHERRSGNPFPSAISAHQQCRVFPRLLLVFLQCRAALRTKERPEYKSREGILQHQNLV